MNIAGIVSNQPYRYPTIGCDLPQDGGISGTLGTHNRPIPGACEERPAVFDPKTGEMVYVDEYYRQQNDPFVSFSTTA